MKLPELHLRDLFWLVLVAAGFVVVGCSSQPPESRPVPNAEQNSEPREAARRLFHRAVASEKKGEYDEGIESYSEAIRIDPANAVAHNNRGNLWRMKRRYDQALTDFSEAIRLNPEYGDAFYNRGVVHYGNGEVEKAIADFTEAIRLNPKDSDAYSSRGNARFHLDEFDKAIPDFDEAIRLDPHNFQDFYYRGVAWSHLQEFDKALADYEAAMRLNGNDARQNECLAWLLATCPSEAIRDGKRAIELATTACELTAWQNDIPIATLAAAHAESGDFEEAVQRQQQAISLIGNDAVKTSYEKRLKLYKNRTPYRHGAG